jgi:hypothetical protein
MKVAIGASNFNDEESWFDRFEENQLEQLLGRGRLRVLWETAKAETM